MPDIDAENQKDFAVAQAAVQQALRSPLPRFYINAFINVLTDADMMMLLQTNQQTVGIVNMNYTVAKSLMKALSVAVESYEKKFETKVPDIQIGTGVPKQTTG